MKIPPFATTPVFQPRPWGGRAMAERLGKRIPDGPIGESWEVSAHPNGVSRASGGPFDGMPLDELARRFGPDLMGTLVWGKYGGIFPLLVKLIDVNSLASVQVHPNDEQAQRLEGLRWGKTEAWYIIDCGSRAAFFVGLQPGTTPADLRNALSTGTAKSLLVSPEVRAGDCIFVPPGTVHAVGEGAFLLEIQQSSDITYRVYDWNRKDEEGRMRELHIDKAFQVIDFSARPQIHRVATRMDALNRILSCDLYAVDKALVSRGIDLPSRSSCTSGTVITGDLKLRAGQTLLELRCGDSFMIPALTDVRIEKDGPEPATAILTEIR